MALSSDSAFVQVNVRYRVEGLQRAEREVKRTAGAFANFGKILKQVSLSLIAFKAFDTFRQGMINVGRTMIEFNATLERSQAQLRVYTGSVGEAAELMDFLRFQSTRLAGGIVDLLGASTALQTFGLDTRRFLELTADVATSTNRSVEDVAIAIGRVIAGDPRTKQFLVTRRADVEVFNQVLEQTGDRALAVEAAFARMRGTSEELQGTWFRLTEQLGDLVQEAVGLVGKGVFGDLRDVLQDVVQRLEAEIFTEEGQVRKNNVFFQLGQDIKDFIDDIREAGSAIENLRNILTLVVGGPTSAEAPRAQEQIVESFRQFIGKEIFREMQEARRNLALAPRESMPFPIGSTDEMIDAYQSFLLSIFGLGPAGATQQQRQQAMGQALEVIDRTLDEWDDVEAQARHKRANEMFKNRERINFLLPISGGTGRVSEQFDQEFLKSIQDRAAMQLDIMNNVAREVAKTEEELERRFLEGKRRGEEMLIEELAKKRAQAFQNASIAIDRVMSDAGFLLFGGREANARIDAQIEKLQQEVDVMNGVTAPLTRQEELMNRIVELESQRITINERIGSIIRRTLGDLAQAAAKAALLRAFGFGTERRGQSGGFLGLLKTGLGIARLIPGPQQAALNAGVSIADTAIASFNAQTGGFQGAVQSGIGVRAPKPVIVNNPIFLSNDIRNVSEKFAMEAEKRMR